MYVSFMFLYIEVIHAYMHVILNEVLYMFAMSFVISHALA
jgi:hypothetical protein